MLQDLKHACRELLKNRWFTCITVLTLALGIGANTAIFGVVNRLMLNPLPYADADQLVYLRTGGDESPSAYPTPPSIARAWREQARSIAVEAYTSRDVLSHDENGARVLRGMRITPGLPALLGAAPVLGRGFAAPEAEAGAPAVVMLSYEAWQREYGGARDVLGSALTLDDVAHTVVGVLPPRWDAGFTPAQRPDVWLPLYLAPVQTSPTEFQFIEVLGRVQRGANLAAVQDELDVILQNTLAQAPRRLYTDNKVFPRIERPSQRLNASTRDTLLVLFGAVGLVLLVACSNVANLLLARGASRSRELSLRSALGASTWRLVRALFAECLVLALAAGAVGVAVGWLTLRILIRVRPNNLPALSDLGLDLRVFAFTFGVAVVTALLFGIAPALQLTARKLGNALRHGASGVVRGGSGARLRKLLVAAQMAMSVMLLVSAGLLVRSVIYLQHVDVGFDTDNLFSAQLALPRARYLEPTTRELAAEQLIERIRAAPGVAAATQVYVAPPNYAMMGVTLEIRGRTLSEADARGTRAFNYVRPDYFSTLGIRLVEGRTFTADELRSGTAIIVNRAVVQQFWPDGGAVGAELKWQDEWLPVVGVVDNVISNLMQSVGTQVYYLPQRAQTAPVFVGGPPSATLIVRAAGDPAAAIAAVRAAVREIDPEIAIRNVLMTETAFAGTIEAPRFNMALLTAFAVIALVLAAVGLAAVIGYEVTERTHEIGIRMALGARTENVRRLAMRHGLTPAFIGVVLGVSGALGATQLATRMLYGVAPRDPLTFVGVVGLLVLVALGASWLPARRATRVDPIAALRAD